MWDYFSYFLIDRKVGFEDLIGRESMFSVSAQKMWPWAAGGAAQRPRRAAGSAETPPVAPRRASGQTLWNPETKATRWLDENDTEFLKYLHTETLWASLS